MKTILLLPVILLSLACAAQDAAFIVLDVSGAVTIGQNKKALIGTKVADNETVTVPKGGKITLACKDNGYADFNTPGKYTVKSAQYCKPPKDPTIERLCRYAWHQVSGHEEADWREHLDNVGAASRGVCDVTVDRNIQDIVYADGDFNLSWQVVNTEKKMGIKLYKNINSKALFGMTVADTNVFGLAALAMFMKTGTDYYWKITGKGDDCPEAYHIKFVSRQYRDSVVKSFAASVNEVISDKAEQNYQVGILLENAHYFADAYAYYVAAAKLAPADNRYAREMAAFEKKYTKPSHFNVK